MSGAPSLQPRWCDECGRQEMNWIVSGSDTTVEKEIEKDTERRKFSLNALFGNQNERTTGSGHTDSSKHGDSLKKPFQLCPNPTCEEHMDGVGDVISWKIQHASPYEYSEEEVNDIVNKKIKQDIRDYRTIAKNVKNTFNTLSQSTHDNKASSEVSNKKEVTTTEENANESAKASPADSLTANAPSLQIPQCEECGAQKTTEERSVKESTAEKQTNNEVNSTIYSVAASSSLVPFINVGGETEESDETTIEEKSSISTTDTATFPLCPTRTCAEHLMMIGQIECWKRRNDSNRKYSAEEIDDITKEALEQEIRRSQIITENVETIANELLDDSKEQKQGTKISETSSSSNAESNKAETPPDADSDTPSEKTADAEHQEGTTTKGDRYLDEYDPQKAQTNGTGKHTGAEPADTDDQKQEQEAEATEESSNSVAKSEEESGLADGFDATEEETADAEMQEEGTNKGDRYLDEYATKNSQSNNTGKYVEEDTGKSV